MKIGLNCYLTANIVTKVLQKCSLRRPLSNIWILSKPLNLIGCHGNRMATEMLNLRKQYSKIISSEVIRGLKLKLCRTVHNINLYKTCVFIAVAHVLSLLWKLKVSLTYNGKSASRPLLLFHCRYFDRTFFINVY